MGLRWRGSLFIAVASSKYPAALSLGGLEAPDGGHGLVGATLGRVDATGLKLSAWRLGSTCLESALCLGTHGRGGRTIEAVQRALMGAKVVLWESQRNT